MKLFIKRFSLVIVGIILSLVILECGLRLAGWTISSYQQYKNNKALRNKSLYTIMCLGESTTHNQYPIQLQQLLDKKYPNKFSVIDCAIPGTTLRIILNLLEDNITKYKPDITICMMGINNGLTIHNQNLNTDNVSYIRKSKNLNIKIYKLFILLKKHLQQLLNNNILLFANDNILVNYSIKLREQGKFQEAEILFKKILENDPENEIVFNELCVLYADFLSQNKLGYNMAIEALDKNFSFGKEWYYKIIFKHLLLSNDINKLKQYINKALNEDINIFSSEIKYFIYNYIKNYITDEQKNKILKIMIKNNDTDYGILAIDAIEQKNYQKSYNYFAKAEEIRLNFPKEETYNLYKLIIKKLIDNNIKVICMQYPVRSIKSLQEQLKNELYYDKITFISNEKNFKNALIKRTYNEIFEDQFAGDFGHCTGLGNTLIAKNVVKTLEDILNLQEN